jgi:hypothetical protein
MIDIKDISGKVKFSTPINVGAKGRFMLMKEDYITIPFSTDIPVDLKRGDYVDLRGVFDDALGGKLAKVYKYLTLQNPSVIPGKYSYELRFDAYYYEWNTKIFKFTPESHGQEAGWNLTAPLDVHLGLFLRNLKANGYTYNGVDYIFDIDSTVENKAFLMTYDNIHLLDALFSMASKDKWNCDCWITDNVIHFGRCEFGDAVDIELGVEAAAMTRSESKGTYATRVYVFGGTRNIPANYRPVDEQAVVNGVVQKRLMLPEGTPCIDAYPGMTDTEAVEDVVVFDDVFPKRIGTLSDVTTIDRDTETDGEVSGQFKAYQYQDPGLDFKEDYILEGEELKITFQSGKLNGMVFGVTFEPEGTDKGSQIWEIVANEDYGRLLPDEIMCPENGDEYVLSGFKIQLVSDRYIPEAEKELLAKGQEYVKKTSIDDGTYPTTLDSEWVYQDQINRTYDAGQRIRLINPAFFPSDGRISRVIGWEMNLDIPYDSPVYTIGESTQYSRIGELEDKVDTLTYKGQTYTGGSGSGVYVIRTNDSTPASDSNVFSALRSLATFLRKDKPDQTKHLIKFLGGLISDNIESQDFAAGPFGTGFVVKRDPKTGKSYIEADEIYIRLKAYFDTLEIKHLAHVGGRIVLSPASMECIKVEEVSAENEKVYDSTGEQVYDSLNDEVLAPKSGGEKAYRCYFKQTDGEREIVNEFAVDDLAQCREFNVKTGTSHNVSNQYYWRRVLYVGEDYIDLSITDCDTGSMAPKAGDTIVTVGNKTNKSRQNVVFFSSYDEDAPCVKLYSGVDSYSMLNKEVTAISPNADKNVFTGKMIIKPGSTGFGNLADAPNMDEINGAIADAKDAAENAKDAAEGVQESMSDLKGYVDGAFSDGIVSEAEAKAIEKYLNIVNNEKLSAESVFNKLYANPYLEGSAKVSLSNARSSLLSSITALSGSIETAIGDGKATMAEKRDVDTRYADFNARLSAFRAAIETANKSIQDKLKSYSDNAQKAADEANNAASSAMEDANEARQSVSDLNKYVDGAFSDGIISGAEAKAIEKYLNTVSQSRKEMDATYTSLYVNPFLSGAPKSALYAAKNSLNTATANLTAAIQSAISDGKTTVTEKEIVDSKFSAFNNACASLATAIENANKAIQQKIKEEAVSESRSEASSEIGKVSQADRDNIARMLGYKDYEELVYYAERGMTLINGGTINTSLVNAELMITSALIANAIKTNTLNVNDRFKIYTDGSVEMSGILHSLGRDTELVVSDGYVMIMYRGGDVAKLSVNENTGMPELSLYNGSRSCIVTAEKIMLSTGTGNTSFLTMDASVLGYGTIKKKTDGTLYLANNEYEMITVGISASPTYGGTTIPSPSPMHMVMRGESETVEAVPAEGYEFDRWSDGGSRKHTVTWSSAGQSLVAYFTRIQVTRYTLSLSASPSSGGSVSGSGGYDAGSKATVSCAAASGWRFVRWSDGGYQTHSVTMDGNKSLTAYFERYTVTGDEIFSGVALTSGSYWNAYGDASVVSVGGGTASVRFNGWSGESNYAMFNRGYMGGKLEQGHKYRMTLSMKASISSASLIGFIGSSFADYVSEDVLFYGSYNGGELSTSYKILTAEFTARRDSTASDGFIFVTAEGCTVSVNSISLKEV